MRYSGFIVNVLKLSPYPRRILLSAFVVILLVSSASIAASPDPTGTDEVKKLLKEATKLTRAGSFVEAEAVLRRAVDLDATRTEAKVALAYVYLKERRLRDAYDTCF